MTNVYEKVNEFESLETFEIEQSTVQESIESEVDELLGDLNPRYFEEIITLNEAQTKMYSSHFNVSGNYNIFNSY